LNLNKIVFAFKNVVTLILKNG